MTKEIDDSPPQRGIFKEGLDEFSIPHRDSFLSCQDVAKLSPSVYRSDAPSKFSCKRYSGRVSILNSPFSIQCAASL